MFLQFIAALVGSGVIVSAASLVWPRFIQKPPPAQLEKVREVVLQTSIGQKVDGFLQPLSVSSVAGSLVESAERAVTTKVTQEVTSRAVSQIISQIDKLPQEQRTVLEEAICKK